MLLPQASIDSSIKSASLVSVKPSCFQTSRLLWVHPFSVKSHRIRPLPTFTTSPHVRLPWLPALDPPRQARSGSSNLTPAIPSLETLLPCSFPAPAGFSSLPPPCHCGLNLNVIYSLKTLSSQSKVAPGHFIAPSRFTLFTVITVIYFVSRPSPLLECKHLESGTWSVFFTDVLPNPDHNAGTCL